jgi:ubiquinone biosynthesis protein
MALDAYMQAPKVVWEGVGKRVLTLEWVRGQPLTAATSLGLPGLDRPTLANNVIRAFLTQALDHGVFHADLHEGNLFAAPPHQLFAVDFGIVGRLGEGERRFLAEILWGFLQRDYRRVAQVHFDAGYVPAHHSVDAFAQALRAVGEPVAGRKASDVSMGRLLGLLFEITAIFDMHLRPELVLLQKTMASVEGVARRIDADHDIWSAARPVVERWITRELSPLSRAQRLAEQGVRIVEGLARWAETTPPAPAPPASRDGLWIGLAVGLSFGALAIALLAFALR